MPAYVQANIPSQTPPDSSELKSTARASLPREGEVNPNFHAAAATLKAYGSALLGRAKPKPTLKRYPILHI